jgi:hypothetical protein
MSNLNLNHARKISAHFEKMTSVATSAQGAKVEVQRDICLMCQKVVYPMDKLSADDKVG